jgi:hypothetical protein
MRRSLKPILQRPFERVVVAHGEVVEENGRDQLVRGYAWVLDEKNAGPNASGSSALRRSAVQSAHGKRAGVHLCDRG